MENIDDKDINDIFDDILLTEERLIETSYREGYKIGTNQPNLEAYHLGYHKGAEFGYIIGYITAFLQYYCKLIENGEKFPKKIVEIIEILQKQIENFPKENRDDSDIDYAVLLKSIEANFKKLCALLRVHPEIFNKQNNLSF